jgi:membrane-bound lytic murein transglycosylase B
MIVALWGIETDFGRTTGTYPVVPALVTLAYDGRRSAFFRSELLLALRILDEGHVHPDSMIGSWAGAMGQNQFMPSSFVNHAVDYDQDGRQDIWTSRADVFASTANYLARSGWRRDESWGREALLPAGFDTTLANGKTRRPLSDWVRLGVRPAGGAAGFTDPPDRPAAIVRPAGSRAPAYIVYDNFDVILRWNRSTYFAVAAGTLADRIGGS